MREKKVAKRRQPKVEELTRLMMNDPDVRTACRAVITKYTAWSLGDLAARYPKVFDGLHASMKDLAEQDPYESRPRFLS